MDPLTHLIELLQPRSFLWKQLIGKGAWEWRFSALDGVVFGWVVSGRCRFEVPGGGEHEMGPGDYLLLANPRPWFLRSGQGAAVCVDFDTAYAEMGNEDVPVNARPSQGDEEVTRMVAGHFEFDSVNAGLLASLLSPVVRLPASQRGEPEPLPRVLAMIEAEATSDGDGREAVMSRLLEIMLIELLRTPQLASRRRGMLSGLTDPPIAAALRAFHSDIQVPWSVAMMAAEARLSRSAFSDRFTAVVGEPAMSYVLNWRMAVARDALAAGRKSVAQVAAATGYGSVSAFSTAFSRVVGVSPLRYAQGAELSRALDLAHDRDGEILGGDPAPTVGSHDEIVKRLTVGSGPPRAGRDQRGRAGRRPGKLADAAQAIQGVAARVLKGSCASAWPPIGSGAARP